MDNQEHIENEKRHEQEIRPSELLSCPFCGSYDLANDKDLICVVCNNCNACGPWAENHGNGPKTSEGAWNNRKPDFIAVRVICKFKLGIENECFYYDPPQYKCEKENCHIVSERHKGRDNG